MFLEYNGKVLHFYFHIGYGRFNLFASIHVLSLPSSLGKLLGVKGND